MLTVGEHAGDYESVIALSLQCGVHFQDGYLIFFLFLTPNPVGWRAYGLAAGVSMKHTYVHT